MNKTIGILAHVDAGKTTFSEQILYITNSIKSCGRVDYGNTFLDNNEIERQRGITIFSEQAIFNYNSSTYYIVDTPGHIDFSTQTERIIQILDYAIVIVSAVEGIQSHTETLWNLLRHYNIPTFLFINKSDRVGADIDKVVNDLKTKFSKSIFYINNILDITNMNKSIIEHIAEYDDDLLNLYIEDKFDNTLWVDSLKRSIKNNTVFPCMSGSALQNKGISEFLEVFDYLTFTQYQENEEFKAKVYKIKYEEQKNRITYMKALSGKLNVKDTISYKFNNDILEEKINQIYIYNGLKRANVNSISAGQLFAVSGLTNANCGITIGQLEEAYYKIQPTLSVRVIYDKSIDSTTVLKYFKILEAEEPMLNVNWNENTQEIQINIMGTIELEILKQLIFDRFALTVDFSECRVLYKETITSPVIGYGHFEPLRHYAEVNLKLEPATRNTGISFESNCSTDLLSSNFQNLVKTHVFEKMHKGILTGSPITDIKVILINGKAHIKHTEGGDFREATYRAIRQALEKANNILLEPYYIFKINAPLDYIGRIMSDIQKMSGTFDAPETLEDKAIINGRAPVASFMNYSKELISFTKGRANISMMFDKYDVCHNTDEVINLIAYNKAADIENTSSSVFCSKGQSFSVNWNEAEKYMHCINKEKNYVDEAKKVD